MPQLLSFKCVEEAWLSTRLQTLRRRPVTMLKCQIKSLNLIGCILLLSFLGRAPNNSRSMYDYDKPKLLDDWPEFCYLYVGTFVMSSSYILEWPVIWPA